jgi:hypothetical protein
MRNIIAAAAVGVVLIAGQAVASNGAVQQLRAGDRVGASLGESDEFIGSFMGWLGNGGLFGAGAGLTGTLLTSALIIAVTVPVVDEIADNGDS